MSLAVGGRILTRLFGNAISGIAGFAGGTAIGPVLTPAVQLLRNDVNAHYPYVPPDTYTLAAGVAQGQVDPTQAAKWAAMHGIGQTAFDALVSIADVGPALGLAYQAWRRDQLTDAEFTTALKRTGLEEQWFDALKALKQNPLEPAQIATAVHRNIMPAPDLIVREPPTSAGKVEQVPQSPLDAATEAEWSGIDHERLRVLVGITGLPPGLIQMLQLLNRGEVTEDDVRRSVAQSNLRNEYMDVVLKLRRHLLTPHEYEEAALRGIITKAQADAGAALSGMEAEDADLLFEIMGRPLSVHQITTGLERGGAFGGTYADIPEPYRDAVRRSNIRPEYARLAFANRYTIPSYFVLRALIQNGSLTEAEGEQYFRDLGWPPDLAGKAAAAFSGGTAAKADTHISKAQTQLWTTLHRSYLSGESSEAEVGAALPRAGVATGSVPDVLATWDEERTIIRKQLSPAQVKKAYAEAVLNPETGVAWTKDEATAALVARGYSTADATTFLEL